MKVLSAATAIEQRDEPATDVRADDVVKDFGATRALDGVSLVIRGGTVHSLVGENGAGKSTMLGILAGRIPLTSGRVSAFGAPAGGGVPRLARAAGVAAIYQELTIVRTLSALDNVFLGHPLSRAGWCRRSRMLRRYGDLAVRIGCRIPPDAPAGTLSVADQQLLEIMRALQTGARIILFDEPSASLSETERQALHRLIRALRSDGVTVVLVSHNLSEVLALSDRITVFRDGRVVRSGDRDTWDREKLVSAMLAGVDERLARALRGRAVPPEDRPLTRDGLPAEEAQRPTDPLMQVRGLSIPGVLESIDFDLQRNEILGVAGLVGSGRSSLLRALAGAGGRCSGSVTTDDGSLRMPRSVRGGRALGFGLVPEDRKIQGLVLEQSAIRNITLAAPAATARLGWVRQSRARALARAALDEYAFDVTRIDQPVGRLSGGNQQKVLLARWAHARPRVLLADEPTRGIDIGAKATVMAGLRAFATNGRSVVMVSSEIEELLAHCDTVLVLGGGRIAGRYRADTVTEAQILSAAFAPKDGS